MSKKDNPTSRYVTQIFCDERTTRILEKLDSIDKKVGNLTKKEEQKERNWKGFLISALSGAIVALVTWLLSQIKL